MFVKKCNYPHNLKKEVNNCLKKIGKISVGPTDDFQSFCLEVHATHVFVRNANMYVDLVLHLFLFSEELSQFFDFGKVREELDKRTKVFRQKD